MRDGVGLADVAPGTGCPAPRPSRRRPRGPRCPRTPPPPAGCALRLHDGRKLPPAADPARPPHPRSDRWCRTDSSPPRSAPGQRIEQGRLADVRQPDDSALNTHFATFLFSPSGNLTRVQLLHGAVRALLEQHRHDVRGRGHDARSSGSRSMAEVRPSRYGVTSSRCARMSDADPQPPECVAELRDQILEPIVAARSAALLQPQLALAADRAHRAQPAAPRHSTL